MRSLSVTDSQQAYFKSKIRKNRTKHIPIRGIKEDDVPKILLHKLFVEKKVEETEKAILKLPGIKRYRSGLRTRTEKDHFSSHLRKYVEMYQTDCPWEVSTTNRYTITTYEAAVTARRRIKQGDIIKYLTGTLVPLTTEESADLDLTNRNFSIVVSSRKKNSSIFLGPARFANHDCDANGRLVTKGNEGMEVIAMKNIEVGDEITVSYGEDYFGPGNVDCLCHTCELLERNGWTSKEVFAQPRSGVSTPVPEQQQNCATPTKKRKLDSDLSSSRSLTPRPKKLKSQPSPSKLQHSWTPPSTSRSDDGNNDEAVASSITEKSSALENLTLSPPQNSNHAGLLESQHLLNVIGETVSDQKRPAQLAEESDSTNGLNSTISSPDEVMTARLNGNVNTKLSFPISPTSTTPSSLEQVDLVRGERLRSEDHTLVTIKVESVEISKIESDDPANTITVQSESDHTQQDDQINQNSEEQSSSASAPKALTTLSTTKVSKMIESDVTGGSEPTIIPSIEPTNTTATTVANVTVHPISDSIRVPGDYILTRKLLAQPHDRWVQCHNQQCLSFFLQPNGYQTRRECPRCERHSILYGFEWPKTDPDPRKLIDRKKAQNKKGGNTHQFSAYRRQGRSGKGTWVEGGGDEEERVMDHRTIHRFVLPEEEKELTRRGLLFQAEVARQRGDDHLSSLDHRNSRGLGTESVARDTSDTGSATPDEGCRRRSNRFVPNRVYADV